MTKLFRPFVVVMAAVVMTAACGNSPNSLSPSPVPGPSPPPTTPPAISSVELAHISPEPGSTLHAGIVMASGEVKGDNVVVIAKYAVSTEDLAKASRNGDTIVAAACLSTDGENKIGAGSQIAGICHNFPVPSGNSSGATGDLNLMVTRGYSDVTETSHIILYLKFRHGAGQGMTEEPFVTKAVLALFKWV